MSGGSLVVLDGRLTKVDTLVHDAVVHSVADHLGGDGGPSLGGLLLQLCPPSWVIHDGHPTRSRIHVELAVIYEALDLLADMLGVAEVLLEFVVGPLQLLDLGEPPRQFSLSVGLDPLLLLDLLLGPAPLGRDLHEVAGVALGDYSEDEDERLEKDGVTPKPLQKKYWDFFL